MKPAAHPMPPAPTRRERTTPRRAAPTAALVVGASAALLAGVLACGGNAADCAGAAGVWATAYLPVSGSCEGKASGAPLNVTLTYAPLPDGGASLLTTSGLQVVSSSSKDVPGGCDASLLGREGSGPVTQTSISVSFRGDVITGCLESGDYDTASDAGPTNVQIYRLSGRRR